MCVCVCVCVCVVHCMLLQCTLVVVGQIHYEAAGFCARYNSSMESNTMCSTYRLYNSFLPSLCGSLLSCVLVCLHVFSVNVQRMFLLYSFFLHVAVDKKLEASEKVSISRPLLLV